MAEDSVIRAGAERLTETAFRLLVESVVDYAIFLLDPDGYIATWNRGAQRIKGYSAEDIIGQHFSVFYTQRDRDRDHPGYELKVARKNGRYEEEGWRVRKDGTTFWANVVITAVRDETGTLIGFGKVTRDLTQRKLQEERERDLRAAQAARSEAEAANKAKNQFLTTMSHELRTPLNAIIGYVDLLIMGVHGPVNAKQAASLERVRTSSQHLLGLINDVLNIARSETGHIDYEISIERAADLLNAVEPLVATQFATHHVDFTIEPCDPDLYVLCDPDRMQQILLNLLTNAYKFTPEDGLVTLSCTADEEHVHFIVQDNGRGIAKEKLASVFEPFVQIDRHLNRDSQQGVGLGLAISHDLAVAMNGDLTVESDTGKGATFTVILPRAPKPQPS